MFCLNFDGAIDLSDSLVTCLVNKLHRPLVHVVRDVDVEVHVEEAAPGLEGGHLPQVGDRGRANSEQ